MQVLKEKGIISESHYLYFRAPGICCLCRMEMLAVCCVSVSYLGLSFQVLQNNELLLLEYLFLQLCFK